MGAKKKGTGFVRNRSAFKMFGCVLSFLGVGRFVSCLVDKLEEFRSVVVGRKSVADLLSVLRLSNHLLLADLVVCNVDVRASLQIVKLHKSLLGRGFHTAILQSLLRLAQTQVHLKLGLLGNLCLNEQYCLNLAPNEQVQQNPQMLNKVYCTISI